MADVSESYDNVWSGPAFGQVVCTYTHTHTHWCVCGGEGGGGGGWGGEVGESHTRPPLNKYVPVATPVDA